MEYIVHYRSSSEYPILFMKNIIKFFIHAAILGSVILTDIMLTSSNGYGLDIDESLFILTRQTPKLSNF